MQAALIDAVNTVAWITAQANSKKSVSRPKPLPRPAVRTGARPAGAKVIDLSRHPLAQPLPEKYVTRGG